MSPMRLSRCSGKSEARTAFDVALRVLSARETLRRSGALTPQGFGASQGARHAMNSLSVGDALLTAAIMTTAFLLEVGLFAWIGMF
jgi:hypothetical protein